MALDLDLQEGANSPPSESETFQSAFRHIARRLERPDAQTVLFSDLVGQNVTLDSEEIARIAEKIGLAIDTVRKRRPAVRKLELPALAQIKNGSFIAILDETTDKQFECLIPGAENTQFLKEKDVAAFGLEKVYQVSTIYQNNYKRAELGGAREIEKKHWLFGAISQFWGSYIYVALATMFINMIGLATPLFIMNVYDRVLPNKATSSLLALALGVGIALVFDLLLKIARSQIIDQTGRAADQKIASSIFEKILVTQMAARPASTGEYANRVSQYEFLREFFSSNTITTFIDSVFVFIFLIVIYYVAGWLFVIPMIAFILTLTVGLIAQHRIGKRVARAANETAERQSLLVETISSIETVKALRGEGPLINRWKQLSKNASKTTLDIKQLSSGAASTTQYIQQMVSVCMIIFGAFEFAKGNISTGAIIATVMLSGRTVAPLSQIALTLARLKQAMLSLNILNDVMNLPEDRPNTVGFVNREAANGTFAFHDVTFRYPGSDALVLNKLTLSVKQGERVGIIGKIGSGKTTVGRLLSGLYTAEDGSVLLDEVDIRQYHPAAVRSAVAFAGQSVDLFSGTLKENLRVGNPSASDEELVAVAQKTGVDAFASQHPRGFDLPVGERGNNLSGGQKQAVAIARLLLSDPKIVFLDEPSGAMDLATERQLIKTLSAAFAKNVTLVISTHRYSLLELVDRLVVLDQGRVIADGPKEKVLEALTSQYKAKQQATAEAKEGN